MFSYILKRVLIFIPTMLIISILTFALSKMSPGDSVRIALGNQEAQGETNGSSDRMAGEKAYLDMAQQLGFDLPSFYFLFSNAATPDTLYKIIKKPERDNLERLIGQYGDWPEIEQYYHAVKAVDLHLLDVKKDSTIFDQDKLIRDDAGKLLLEYKDVTIQDMLTEMDKASATSPLLAGVHQDIQHLQASYTAIKQKATPSKNMIPSLKWYGLNNQYHRWLSHFLHLDFGISYIDKRPIWSKIKEALPWTLMLNLISILLSYLIAIPIGISSARNKGSIGEQATTVFLFILYSLPVFWVATLLITFVTTPEYGMDWFPTFGVGEITDQMSWSEALMERVSHFILPVFCITYGSLAYLSRQMRGGVLSVFRQDYIRTARAKGLSEGKVVWKHALRNSLIPIITIFASLLPAAISGAFIIEIIFSLPGMGKVAYLSLQSRDYPMVFTVMMFSAFLTLVGTLISDILYAVVDPRISFDK
ncbi:MAG: ABC transporter permease [Bacteroidetes bacterium]|nr:ABC transporter permease [Bacteroidota bacterium]